MVTAFRPRLSPLPCDVLIASLSVFTLSKRYGLHTARGSVMKPCVCGACHALPPLPKSCDTTACLTRPTGDMIRRRKTQGGTHDAIRSRRGGSFTSSNASPPARSTRAPALGWRFARRSWNPTMGKLGWNQSLVIVPRFSLPCRLRRPAEQRARTPPQARDERATGSRAVVSFQPWRTAPPLGE